MLVVPFRAARRALLLFGRNGFGIVRWIENWTESWIELWIEQYDFDSGKALPYGVARFLGIEVGQAAIAKEHLPEATLQVDQSSSTGLFETADRGT